MGIRYNPEIMPLIRSLILVILLPILTIGCSGQFPSQSKDFQATAFEDIIETSEMTITPERYIEGKTPVHTPESSTPPIQPILTPSDINLSSPAPPRQIHPTPTVYDPDTWTNLPVVPVISPNVKEIYEKGLLLGNNQHAFSKIGDCGSTPAWFLGDFDRGPKYYDLGDNQDLIDVIDFFQGSFSRTSLAAKSGFNASSVFAPLWSNRDYCLSDETPLTCEFRENKPIIAFITLGTNDVWHQDSFEPQMRKMIEISIENGVVPILSTKADNLEIDGSINSTIARLAIEYQVPLWNFWAALQSLPNHGLQEDDSHLTWGPNQFDDPQVMQRAWPIRNLTALQVLDEVWRYVASP